MFHKTHETAVPSSDEKTSKKRSVSAFPFLLFFFVSALILLLVKLTSSFKDANFSNEPKFSERRSCAADGQQRWLSESSRSSVEH